ncbi:MAG TPA: DUF58 domain-containing protein [Acidimicrobiales bacterium]|nr:DUF58 domain-containing protein [Acidimicrobiales bacterium]
MLTARGRRTIALALIAGVIGRILGIPELFGLSAAAVVVALAALVRVRMVKGTVAVTARAMPPIVSVGQPALLELTIEESGVAGSLSTPVVLVTDISQGPSRQPAKIVVPRLIRGDRAQVTFDLPTDRRGLIDAGAYEAAVGDPLGLARRHLSTSRPARCIVLPRIEPLATVVPKGLGWVGSESTRSAAERLVTGSSMLRRYSQGDDLRRVHWRTTARVGELMVREGGDRDDPDRIATTVLLDAGGASTPPDELERAVEVAASVLSAAADESNTGVSGAYRVLTTTGLDTGGQRGHDSLQSVLIELAGVAPSPASARDRFNDAVERLGRPDHDEVLIIVGAFGDRPPDPAVVEDLARAYSAVVLVLVGAAFSLAHDPIEARWQADAERAGSRGVLEIGSPSPHEVGGRSKAGVLTVPLPLGRSLAAAWSLDLESPVLADDSAHATVGARKAAG